MKCIIFFVFGFVSICAFADGVVPKVIIKNTIELITSGKAEEAFEYVIGSNPYFVKKKLEVETTKVEFVRFVESVGTPSDCEKFASKNIIKRYRKDTYICLSEVQPFEIHFYFYRQKDYWLVHSFSFSSDLDDLMDHLMEKEISK